VLVTARAAKHKALLDLGAEVAVDYSTEDFVSAVRTATGGRGADVILDIVGGPYLDRNVEALAMEGRLLIIGLQGGRRGEIDLGALMTKQARIVSARLRPRPPDQKAAIVAAVHEHLWPLIEGGLVRPIVHTRLPMTEAAAAHELVESSTHIGKVILLAP